MNAQRPQQVREAPGGLSTANSLIRIPARLTLGSDGLGVLATQGQEARQAAQFVGAGGFLELQSTQDRQQVGGASGSAARSSGQFRRTRMRRDSVCGPACVKRARARSISP